MEKGDNKGKKPKKGREKKETSNGGHDTAASETSSQKEPEGAKLKEKRKPFLRRFSKGADNPDRRDQTSPNTPTEVKDTGRRSEDENVAKTSSQKETEGAKLKEKRKPFLRRFSKGADNPDRRDQTSPKTPTEAKDTGRRSEDENAAKVPLKQDPDDAEQPKEKGKFLIKKLAKGVEKVGRKFEKAPKSPKAEPSVTEAHANNEKDASSPNDVKPATEQHDVRGKRLAKGVENGGKKRQRPQKTGREIEEIHITPNDEEAAKEPLKKDVVVVQVADKQDVSSRHLFLLRITGIVGVTLSVILLTIVIILAQHMGDVQYCSHGNEVIPRDFERPGVFDDLTPTEYKAARDYMLNNVKFKLHTIDKATVNSSYIFMIDLHIPLKSAVLEYLDRGSNRLKRAAKVTVVRGDMKPPRVEEYLVSPLPKPTIYRLARNPSFARFPIPYTSRPVDQVDYKYLYSIIRKFTKQIYHILRESYGLSYHNCTKGSDCMLFYDVGPRGKESGDRKTWFWSYRDVEGFYSYPLGLELQIDHASTDVSEWKIDKIVYNGHLFYLVSELIDRYNNNRIAKINLPRHIGQTDELRSSYYRRGFPEMPTPVQGPKLVEPEGHRFSLIGQHVQYMNWNFNIRMRSSTGIQLFDVRFQSERIAYEISLQDAAIFNSGYGATQSMSNIYASSWFLGASSFELVRGVDCPDTAAFLDNYYFVDSHTPKLNKNAICVFENNPGLPLRRHYSNDGQGGYIYYGGIVDYQLVVRNIASIRNSDFIFDYIFHLNGDIEVKVSTTGYVQTTFKLPFEKPYGNPVLENAMADLHQHLFHFKADLDIGGLRNSYSIINIETETVRHPWYHRQNKTQMSMSEKLMEREKDITLQDVYSPKYHTIYSETAKNRYGTNEAYRIINNAVTEFLISDLPVTNAASWAKYPVVVTKYDDTEDQSSSIYAQNDPWDPVIDFERFVSDNDSIHHEDLVVWLTVGGHHIPQTEDLPSTPTSFNKYNFHLAPFNFFTECPSVSSPNTVHIEPSKDHRRIFVDTFGMSYESSCAQPSVGPYSYYGFRDNE